MNAYLNISTIKPRIKIMMLCMATAFIILMSRLFYLQIIKGKEYQRLSKNNCIRLQTIDAQRGMIFDRKKKLLVDNRPSFNLGIILKDAGDVAVTVKKLAGYLELPADELMDTIKKSKRTTYQPIFLKKDIERDDLAKIEVNQYDLPGVMVVVKPKRNYIYPKLAAHLIGYLGEINQRELRDINYHSGDYLGRYGVEKIAEKFLRGKRGGQQVEVNSMGQMIKKLKTQKAVSGNKIYLSIDYQLQEKTEELLIGLTGAVVAIEPSSGLVLTLANSPAFDSNLFVSGLSTTKWKELRSNLARPMENKAVQGRYPPASTYKIVTAMAGLEEKVITANTTFNCSGYMSYGNRRFHCWKKHGHGSVNVVQALERSCDVFFYHLGQKLGVDVLARYAQGCGLGSLTGIKLQDEARGLIPTSAWKKRRFGENWQGGETLSIAIGQGYNLTTPLQMAVLTAAVANGGRVYRPMIITQIKSIEGEILLKESPELMRKIPVSKATLEVVKQGLRAVVNSSHGTARRVADKNIIICGKTGTAQVVGRKKNTAEADPDQLPQHKAHAWFIGYAPADRPRIAVAALVEHGEHGSSTAAPIVAKIIKFYLGKKN